MATIPEVPASQRIAPISGPEKSVPVPTFDQGGIQAESVFTSPFIAGEGQAKIVGAVAEIFNKAADKTAIQDSAKAGYEEQQARIAQGDQDYIGGANPFTLSGKAYQAGANSAYTLRKERDFKTQLAELADKRRDNPFGFQKEAEELKTKLFKDVPSNLTLDLSKVYDDSRNVFELQIAKKVREDQFNQNLLDHQDALYKTVGDIGKTIQTAGTNAEELPELFVKLKTLQEATKENFGLSPKQLREQGEKLRQELYPLWWRYQFESTKFDPKAQAEIEKQLINGTYTGGELGEKFGQYIPGGAAVTLRENNAYLTLWKKYKEENVQTFAYQKYQFQLNEDQKIDDISRGAGFTKDEAGNIKLPAKQPYDVQTAISLGISKDEAIKKQFEKEVAYGSGIYSYDVLTKNYALMGDVLDDIKAREAQARALEDGPTKILNLAIVEKANKEVQKIIKEREDARAKGTAYEEQYILDRLGPVLFPSGLNPSDEKQTDDYRVTMSKHRNLPNALYGLPAVQGRRELTVLTSALTVDDYKNKARDLSDRQGRYATGYIEAGITNSRGTNTEGLYAHQNYIYLHKSGDADAADQLAAAIFQKKDNIATLKSMAGTEDSYGTEIREATDIYNKATSKSMHLTTSYSKSQYDTFTAIYAKMRAAGTDKKEAANIATNFIISTNDNIKLDNGNKVMVPKMVTRSIGENNLQGSEKIRTQLNDALKNPHDYNIIPAVGQTYDDIIKNISNYRFAYNNGNYILLNQRGDVAAELFMKMPSGPKELLISSAVFSPTGKEERIQLIDKEGTWAVASRSNFSSQISDTYTKNFPGKGMGIYKTSGIQDRIIDNYGEEIRVKYLQTQKTKNDRGQDFYPYNDWIVPSMVGNSPSKQETLQGISLKIAESGLTNVDAMWLGRNVPYLDMLLNDDVRFNIIKEYNNQRKGMSASGGTKIQTKNVGATVMSPLQLLTSISRKTVVFDDNMNMIPESTAP